MGTMRLRLSTDDHPEDKRFEFWHDAVCQDLFHVTPAPLRDLTGFKATLDVQIAGRFALSEMQTTHGSIEKTAGDTARAPGDSVLVFLAIETAHHYRMGGHEVVIEPGDVGILPMAERFHCVTGGIAFRSMVVPSGVLGPQTAGREVTRPHRLPGTSPMGVLVAAGLNAAAAQLPHLSGPLGEAVLQNLSGLVALALGASEEGRQASQDTLRAARLEAIKRRICTELADPALSPATVAAAFRISPRQLHLLFQPTGQSFAQYVLQRRLEACRATLSSPASLGRSVADVAFGWGFNSLSVFYRAFAAEFAASPGSVREAAIARAVQGAASSTLKQ